MNRFAKSAGWSVPVCALLCFLGSAGAPRAGLVDDGGGVPKPSEAEDRPVIGGAMPGLNPGQPAVPTTAGAPAVAPNAAGSASPPQKAPTLDDLSRDFSSQAFGGLNKAPAAAPRGSPPKDGPGRDAPANDPLPLDAVPLSDVRNMLKDLSQVDTVNGLGEAVGFANKVKAGVGGVMGGKGEGPAINGLGERVGGSSSASGRANQSSPTPEGYGERPSGGGRPVEAASPPGWLSSVLDGVHDLAGFARDNAILVIVCCLLVLGVTGLAQRKR